MKIIPHNTAPDKPTDEQEKERYKQFIVDYLASIQDLEQIKRAYAFVEHQFLNDTGGSTSPQEEEKRKLLADITHYCKHIPVEQLTHIHNICNYIYNIQ